MFAHMITRRGFCVLFFILALLSGTRTELKGNSVHVPDSTLALAEEQASIQIYSGGRSFDSIEDYDRSKAPSTALISGTRTELKDNSVHVPDILGVTPSLAQVVGEFQRASFDGRPVCARDRLMDVFEAATAGKKGPLLLVADQDKVRILELKPSTGSLH